MAVDWSLPKNVYEKMHTKGLEEELSNIWSKILTLELSKPVQNDSYGIQSNPIPSEIKEEKEEEIEEEEEDEEEEEEVEETPSEKSFFILTLS